MAAKAIYDRLHGKVPVGEAAKAAKAAAERTLKKVKSTLTVIVINDGLCDCFDSNHVLKRLTFNFMYDFQPSNQR